MAKKIPASAKLVFKGATWSVYQWKQKMFDGTYETFEGLARQSGVKILATDGAHLLISKETQPGKGTYYALFGGGIKEGETPLEAAKRELLEETGMVSKDWELIDEIDVLSYPFIDYYSYLYAARNCTKESNQRLDKGERIRVEKVSPEQLVNLLAKNKGMFGSVAEKLLNDPASVALIRSKLHL